MGTNYYHRHDACECCGRYDERHICKSLTSFQGYRPDPMWPDDFVAPPIQSWRDWRTALRGGGEVWDEYGRQHDVEEFITDVEATEPKSRRRQYEWMRDHYGRDAGGHDWLDGDGFSFTETDFT